MECLSLNNRLLYWPPGWHNFRYFDLIRLMPMSLCALKIIWSSSYTAQRGILSIHVTRGLSGTANFYLQKYTGGAHIAFAIQVRYLPLIFAKDAQIKNRILPHRNWLLKGCIVRMETHKYLHLWAPRLPQNFIQILRIYN